MQDSRFEFWQECEEVLERISKHLTLIERQAHNPELLDSLYREVHTLKGTAQLFGVTRLSAVAHTLETNMDFVRRAPERLSGMTIEMLFRGLSLLERVLSHARGVDQDFSDEDFEAALSRLLEMSLDHVNGSHVSQKSNEPYSENLSSVPPEEVSLKPSVSKSSPANESVPAPSSIPAGASVKVASADEAGNADSSSSIRVPVGLLDKLMTLMGEMVLVRNQVLQYSSRSDDLGFLNLSQRLDVVTSELQSEMMKTRMQPMGNILNKFQRLVRDLSKELGKKIDLELSGTETELDKSLIEAVKDPLTHIIRNACDHGMELPADRLRSGKPETGKISVRSFHEGGQVIIEISDDGRGLNRDVLVQRAIEKGLISKEKASQMSEREVYAIIFMPGFSTAAKVTNISGRGVGMDVVRQNIERIGGVVELQSRQGYGTTIRLKIPLTLAIVPAMVVRGGEERYAIPQVKLVELLRIESTNSQNKIETLQGKKVLRLRGDLLPLLSLNEFMRNQGHSTAGESIKTGETEADVVNIVVLRAESQMFGLIVDEILDTADIVVKPLNRFLKALNVYSGATVLGDGSVALILDVMGVAQRLRLSTEVEQERAMEEQAEKVEKDVQEFLLFKLGARARHAIPLDLVHRLEEFERSSVELSGGSRVIRYRDSILPIISLNEKLQYEPEPTLISKDAKTTLSVIVTQRSGRLYGIEVNEILDVLKTENSVDVGLADREGILGSMISGDEVIVVVDVLGILERHGAGSRTDSHAGKIETFKLGTSARRSIHILYAEDNAFFRKHVGGLLEREGFKVYAVTNGAEALETLAQNSEHGFDLVISDIEMPVMGGLEFVKRAKQDQKTQSIPFIALSTKGSRADVEEGLRVGFNHYMEKLNPTELINSILQFQNRKVGAA